MLVNTSNLYEALIDNSGEEDSKVKNPNIHSGLGEFSDIFAASAINDSRNIRMKAFGQGAHGGIRLGIATQLFIPKDQLHKKSDGDSSQAHMTD